MLLITTMLAMGSCEKVELGEIKVEGNESVNKGDNADDNVDDDDDSDDDSDADVPAFLVEDMPQTGDIWNGHVVAYADEDDTALLLSTVEWNDVPSALNVEDTMTVRRLTKRYNEGGIGQWSIPTRDEARLLREIWDASTLPYLNQALISIGGSPLVTDDRYLCESGTYTFSFAERSSVTKAGTKRTYRLRLVKTVRFIL